MTDAEPTKAAQLNELGRELADAGRTADAEGAYRAAIAADPRWSIPWFNLGLVCKYQGRWAESLAHNQRSAELAPDDKDAWWNLGIAASALGDWAEARRAWAAVGIELAGDGPPAGNFGITPLRLDPDGAGEVVWGERLDPARAELRSVPLPETGFRYRDIVLNDGARNGTRVVDGQEYSVFDVLARLVTSPFHTWVVEVAPVPGETRELLSELAAKADGAAEHWGSSTRNLCAACSRGAPHTEHDSEGPPAHPDWGVAARDEPHLQEIFRAWRTVLGNRAIRSWRGA